MLKNIILALSVIFFSCTANDPTPPGSGNDGTLTFDANGEHIVYSGTYESTVTQASGVYGQKAVIVGLLYEYVLHGQNGTNNLCFFTINTDTLEEKTYYLTGAGVGIDIDGQLYTSFDSTKKFIMNITRHSGGRLNATFNGNLYWPIDPNDPHTKYDSIIVTNGVINNMEMIY